MATKKSQLVLTCNAQAIKDVFEYLNDKLAKIKLRRDALLRQYEGKMWTAEAKKEFKQLGDDIAAITSMQQKNEEEMRKYGQVMQDLSGSKLRDVKGAVREVSSALNKMTEKDPNRQKLIDDLAKLKNQISVIGGSRRSLSEVTADLKNLSNVRFDHLQQDLEAVRAKYAQLTTAQRQGSVGQSLKNSEQLLTAQMAVAQTPVSATPVAKLNAQQLRAEQTALNSAMAATNGVKGYETYGAQAAARLRAVNEQLTILSEKEKQAAADARNLTKTQQASDVVLAIYRKQAVSLEELDATYKTLEARANKFAGVNPAKAKAAQQQMAAVAAEIKRIKATMQEEIRIDKDFLRNATNQQLQAALAQLQQKFQGLNSTEKATADRIAADMKRVQNQIDQNTAALNNQKNAWGSLGTTLKNLTAYVGVFAMFNKLKGLFEDFISKNREFSDQLANVRKVSNLAMEDIKELANNLSKIDSRTSLKGLIDLSYTGAKLGFGNYGIEGLESFAKSAVKVQNALSEDMGADAMTALSKMVEVMGLIPKMGVERAMDATGSAIFKLASTSTATGTNIVEFSKRLMGLANIAHITTPELLAIGSAADSMALMPEVAATAFNKLITAMQKQPNLIENALKIDKGTISDLYQAGKMTDAMVLVFEKMREKGGMNALMQSGVFKDLGSDGARLVAVMATMANRVDMLNAHLAVSRQAFEEGTAVAQEYAIQMDTAAAYSERAANIWEKAFVNPEGVDVVKEFSKAWYEVSKSLTSNEKFMLSIKLSLQGILLLLKGIMAILPELLAMLLSGGFGMLIANLKTSEGLLASLTSWFGKLTVAQKAFFKAAGWVGLALTIFEVGKAIYDLSTKVKEANEYMKGFDHTLSDLNREYGKSELELRRYKKAIDEANTGTKQRMAAITNFNSKFGPYLKNLLTEKSTALDVAKAYDEVTKALRAKLALQLKEKDINEQVLPREQWTADRRQQYDAAAKRAGKGQYGSGWITGYAQDNASKSIDDMVSEIGKKFYNIPDAVMKEVMVQAKAGNKEFNNWGSIINSRYLNDANAILAASAYLRQDRSAQNAMRRVNQKWKPEQDAMDAYLAAQQQEEPIGPLNPAPDKDAEKALTKAQRAEKKRLKDEMDEAEKDSTAVINAIEEFYRLQESAVEQLVADGKMTREEADRALNYVKNRKDLMLMNARRAIAGKDSDFENLRKTMGQDMLRPDDQNSQRAMNTVQTIDVAEAAKRLQKFDGSKAVYDLNAGSFTQAMLKNAAQNELNIQRRQAAVQVEIDKILMQYQFVEQAQRTFGDKLVKLGLITDGYDKVVQQLADGTEVVANTKDVQKLADKTVKMDTQRMYGVDTNDALELRNMVDAVMHTVDEDGNKIRESFASMFPNLDEWMENPEQYKEQMQAFYKTLIDMDTDYYKALKQNYEQESREFTERWQAMGWTDQEKREDTGFEMQGSLRKIQGEGENFGQTYGFADTIADDPEIARIKNRMEWRAKELEDLQNRNASEELIMQKQNEMLKEAASLAEKVSQEIADRISKVQTLSEPLNSFGEEVGQMLGEQWQGISREGKLSFGQMAKNMGIEYAKLTLKMASENLMKKLQQGLFYKQMEMEEMAHQVNLTNIAIQGATARQQAQAGIGQLGLVTKSAQDAAEIGAEGGKATIMTMFGISEGASKIIATLGFWGIPLIGVITSILMGLLNSAKSTASQESSSMASSSAATPKTKLVSGMLTYDKGNVDRFAGRRKLYDDGTTQVYGPKRYIGQDGKVYTATEEPAPKSGLVKHPIATTVEGQPALVAEKGPEIVIGRETTANIMRNAPELLQAIVDIDKNPHKKPDALPTYDKGNVSEVAGEAKAAENSEKVQEVTMRVNRDNRYHTERQDERNNEEQSVAMSEESLQRMMEQFRKTRISHEATNKHRRQQEDSRKESMRRDSVTTDAKDSTESLTRWFRDFATAEMTTQYVTLGEWAKVPESHIGEIKQLYKVLSSHDEQTRRSDQQAIERTMDTINNVKDITSVKAESENTVVSEEALSKMTAKFRTIEEQRRLDTNDTAAVTRWLNDFVTTTDTSAISRQTSDIKNREVREQFVKSMPAVEQWQTEPEKHVREIIQLYNTLATHDEQMRRSEQEHAERSIATVNDVMSIIGMKTDATSTDRQQSVKITEDIATEMVRKHRQVEEQRRLREEQEQKRVKDATNWLRDFVTTDVTSLEDVRSQKEDVTKKLDVSSKKSDVQDTSTVSHQTSDIKNSEVRESFTKTMPHVDEWLKEPEKHVEEIMQLRSMLTRYDEQLQRSEVENAEHNEVDSKQRIARSISDNIDRNETAAFSDEVLNQMVSKHRSINEQHRLREEQEQKRSSVDERSRSDVQDVRRTFDKGNVEEVTKRRRLDTSNTEEMTRWLNDFVTTDVTSLEDVRSQKEDVSKKSAVSSKKSDIQGTLTVSRQTSDIKNREIRESFTKAMPHVDEWLQEPEKHQQEIAKLYTTLTDIDERERISREESSRMDDRRTDSATVRRDSVTTDKNIALTEQYYKGEDGRTYKAQPGAVPEGVTLLTKPIATMINGEPSLVAEKGPELVIGRETTKAMQLNRPDLLRAIVSFDKNKTQQSMRMFDQGNIQSIGADTPETPVSDANEERQALRQQMTQMQDVMNGVLYYLQHPVRPKIDMYSHGGEDGLYDSMKKATKFMSRYGG